MIELVLATTNIHKVREIRALLACRPDIDLYSLLDFPHYVQPEETGKTFEENAILKAEDAAVKLGKWTIADDSGLVVPALNGEPGVYSARYSGQKASDKENRKKLLKAMERLEGPMRSAYFECCIALVSPKGWKKCLKGTVEGMIAPSERGKNGFGYDALFVKHDYAQTFGELQEEIKNKISHRAKAMEKLLLVLESDQLSS